MSESHVTDKSEATASLALLVTSVDAVFDLFHSFIMFTSEIFGQTDIEFLTVSFGVLCTFTEFVTTTDVT